MVAEQYAFQDPWDRRQHFPPGFAKERDFVPLQQGSSTITFSLFNSTFEQKDLCQSLPLEYQEEAVHHGITTYR